ncbi:hypothetical protein AYI81_21185 [Shewanella algae]|nr:hypothetical protein AYI80_21260 [Shewanella algae]TXS81999.1 hypothetical protein AYI81_21185 [Shewanella algae]
MAEFTYECPVCGSPIKAWADLEAKISFSVSKSGKLTKQFISNTYQTDGRRGVECSNCNWSQHVDDLDVDSPFVELANTALKRQEQIDWLSVQQKRSS